MAGAATRRLAKKRKEMGLRKNQPLSFASRGTVTKNVTIPDINHGAWSFICQPPAPDFKESYSFL